VVEHRAERELAVCDGSAQYTKGSGSECVQANGGGVVAELLHASGRHVGVAGGRITMIPVRLFSAHSPSFATLSQPRRG
jgi:hypothetical protein